MIRYLVTLTLVLAALWLALSGIYTPPILALGAVSITLAVWLGRRMNVVGVQHHPGLFSWRLPLYWIWLVWQIFRANVRVARRVLSFPLALTPRVVRVPISLKDEVARVTYANSVTLTPGTVSMFLEENDLVVHALTADDAANMEAGRMAAKVAWLERGS